MLRAVGEAGDGLPSAMGKPRHERREDAMAWTAKAGEAIWQRRHFGTTLGQGAEDRHGPFPIPSNVGWGLRGLPGAVQAISP